MQSMKAWWIGFSVHVWVVNYFLFLFRSCSWLWLNLKGCWSLSELKSSIILYSQYQCLFSEFELIWIIVQVSCINETFIYGSDYCNVECQVVLTEQNWTRLFKQFVDLDAKKQSVQLRNRNIITVEGDKISPSS